MVKKKAKLKSIKHIISPKELADQNVLAILISDMDYINDITERKNNKMMLDTGRWYVTEWKK